MLLIKIENIQSKDLVGLYNFAQNFPDFKTICVCNINQPLLVNNIEVIPFKLLFNKDYLDLI